MRPLDKLLEVNNIALKFFTTNLELYPNVTDYLSERLSADIINKFNLGYCPEYGLLEWLDHHGVDFQDAERLGLMNFDFDDNYDKVYKPVFYNRVMIPIYHGKKIVGFGGRTLGQETEFKYVNSKNSALYQKGRVLYGLDHSRARIHKAGYAILVEGYFDVLGLHAVGVKNCCAVCGSSLTKNQALLLKRYTKKVITLFDGDKSGRLAGERAREKLEEVGIFGGTVLIKKGYDPDTYVKEYGRKALKKLPVIQ